MEPPSWLSINPESYRKWVARRAKALSQRDRDRGSGGSSSQYRRAIHEAVVVSGGKDYWTGEPLDWSLIGTYSNESSQLGRAEYKQAMALLPTIDHRGAEPTPEFVICGWRTNNVKHDMTELELLEFCRKVVAHFDRAGGADAPTAARRRRSGATPAKRAKRP